MKKKDGEGLRQLEALCRFAYEEAPNGIDVELLFRSMGERKTERIWSAAEAAKLQEGILYGVRLLYSALYSGEGTWSEVTFQGLPVRLSFPGITISYRETSGPLDTFQMDAFHGPKKAFSLVFPLILFRVIEICAELPADPFRFCAAEECDRFFVSYHKRRLYCSENCRYRTNYLTHYRKRGRKIKMLEVVK
jgi:hypothetical protein